MTRFVDFNNQAEQFYFFPKDLIDHLIKTCNLPLSHNLMRSCKSLRIRQAQIGKGHIEDLIVESYSKIMMHDDWLHEPLMKKLSSKECLQFQFNTVKIWKNLMLRFITKAKFEPIIFKIDLSEIKEISIEIEFELSDWIINKLLQPSLKKLRLTLWFQDCTPILCEAFKKCHEAETFEIKGNRSRITNKDLKNLISIDREIKLQHCSLYSLLDIELTNLFIFVDKHIEPTGNINVHLVEVDEIIKENIKKEWTLRRKIIPMPSLRQPELNFY